jgi:HPt (histidine-containing phosphotransfer) domain-containing protein
MILDFQVEGLDSEKGLERFGGDGKAYMDSLRSYVVHTPSLLETAMTAKTVGAFSDYAITIHGIKGSSYGISANAIGQRAEKLEHAAKAGNSGFIEEENDRFIVDAEQFIVGVTRALDELDKRLQKPVRDVPDPYLLVKIRDAAENYDIGEIDDAMEELEQYSYESEGELVPWLREQIDRSEFAEIIERLLPMKQEVILYAGA